VIPEADTDYVVEDDASPCNAESRMLRSAQYRVITFNPAEEFRQSDFKKRHGFFLLDIRLPVVSGIEIQGQLLTSGAQMPVIFIT
jgi:FixJ family two-component response regulator